MTEPPPRRLIQGLIFDCDGTLADTMPLHWRAWETITRRHRLVFPEDRFYKLGGVPSRDILTMLGQEQAVQLDPIAVAREKEEEYLKSFSLVRPIQEIVSVVHEQAGRLPMAVASGGQKPVITKVLSRLGILQHFAAVVTSEDVLRQKPAPDIFLEAARRIGVSPENCRAYEDTDLGLQAIRSAGMEAVDVRVILSARLAGEELAE